MTKRETERRLKQAVDSAAPDDVQGVLSRCGAQKGDGIPMKMKKFKQILPTLVTACLVLAVAGGISGAMFWQSRVAASTADGDAVDGQAEIVPANASETPETEAAGVSAPDKEPTPEPSPSPDSDKSVDPPQSEVTPAVAPAISAAPVQSAAPQAFTTPQATPEPSAPTPATTVTPSTAQFQEQAVAAALAHAGLAGSQVTDLKAEVEWEDGRYLCEVEFWCGTDEYDYEIDYNGAILHYEVEHHTGESRHSEEYHGAGADSTGVGKTAAIAAALNHAGLTESQISRLKCELDEEDGIPVYEVEFDAGGLEYKYEIRTADGAILSYEIERED